MKRSKIFGITFAMITLCVISPTVQSDELVHKFKNPSFSGVGTSAHYLTIENQEKSRTDKIAEDIRAALLKQQREAENTVLAKFIRNLESRIYAQLSKQLVENMFSNEEGANYGTFTLSVVTELQQLLKFQLVLGVFSEESFISWSARTLAI